MMRARAAVAATLDPRRNASREPASEAESDYGRVRNPPRRSTEASPRLRARRVFASTVLIAVLGVAACAPEADVSLTLRLPSSVGDAAWFEVAAVRGACPEATTLLSGLPLGVVSARLAFPAGATRAPNFGALSRERWAFLATARDAQCGVAAIGCKSVELDTTREVTIGLLDVGDTREGACASGLACQYAHCIEVPGSNPSSGTGCSLNVLGGGLLADPISIDVGTSILASPPALASVGSGFFATAVDATADGNRLRVTRKSLAPEGASLEGGGEDVTPCAGTVSVAGVSVVDLGNGKALEARRGPSCGTGDVTFTERSSSGRRALFAGTLPAGSSLEPHSLVRESASGRVYLASTSSQGLRVVAVGTNALGAEVTGITGAGLTLVDMAAGPSSSLWLARDAAGRRVAGLLRSGASQAVTVPEGARAVSARGAGFEVLVVDASGFVRVQALNEAGVATISTDFGAPGGTAVVDAGAIVARGDFTVVALAVGGDVWLAARAASEGANVPNLWRRLGDSVPLVRRRRDGAITLASAGDRIALAWGTAARPTPDDVPFGYAVLGCEDRTP